MVVWYGSVLDDKIWFFVRYSAFLKNTHTQFLQGGFLQVAQHIMQANYQWLSLDVWANLWFKKSDYFFWVRTLGSAHQVINKSWLFPLQLASNFYYVLENSVAIEICLLYFICLLSSQQNNSDMRFGSPESHPIEPDLRVDSSTRMTLKWSERLMSQSRDWQGNCLRLEQLRYQACWQPAYTYSNI